MRKTPEDVVKTSVWLPAELWKRAKVRAVEERRDLRDVIIAALERYLKGSTKEGSR